ncbi:MAG TPA: DNA mismatch repair protein MutS [Candidatus Onthovicinus excrementipullorum]|nr:DNA mismatch repair protein MutS [Candidatus Onthovicinus excrementipullorum]
MEKLSPMMQQYLTIKRSNPDVLLFFRLGDFYELFFDDARLVSSELDLVLTGRDCGLEERAPMCGVPFHSADSYIARLVERGYKVAICEQTEDPKKAKGLVRRDLTRIITPGTVIDSNMLDEGKNNYLACVYVMGRQASICFADVSTGEVHATTLRGDSFLPDLIGELGKFSPSEIRYNRAAGELLPLKNYLDKLENVSIECVEEAEANREACARTICSVVGEETLTHLEQTEDEAMIFALGICFAYLTKTQMTSLENIREVDFYKENQYIRLDAAARRNLELTETMRSREKRGTLLWVLDRTKTAMGRRLLRTWIEQPLLSCNKILSRQNAVAELVDRVALREDLIEQLDGIHDLERLMARVVYATANARELRALADTFKKLAPIKELLAQADCAMLKVLWESVDTMADLYDVIDRAIAENPPFSVREGNLIRDGFDEELDSLRYMIGNGKEVIAQVEESEREKTGIKKLKIGYNRVFGYYIEVPNGSKDMVPESYVRKQTLANCERYITQELKELEAKVLGAQERSIQLEYNLFTQVRQQAADQFLRINRTAKAISVLDVLCSLALVAYSNNYACPLVDTSDCIAIEEGRHPVVERVLRDVPFVPNDTLLNNGEDRCAIITGPNMAGKSTYMRQVALIVIMAQIGSFVPARSAHIGLVDSVFTRVGAADDLASGQSTFMVEMNEVAEILKNATDKSLIIFDEIGRGTSTFDGMSIARAVLEFTASKRTLGAKTLFATHYHELTELEGQVDGVKNYNIAVKKRGHDITFLRRIVRGGADGSYGIDVARLAGVPDRVVARARVILKSLEEQEISFGKIEMKELPEEETQQVSMGSLAEKEILEDLRELNINDLTPLRALELLDELSRRAKTV